MLSEAEPRPLRSGAASPDPNVLILKSFSSPDEIMFSKICFKIERCVVGGRDGIDWP